MSPSRARGATPPDEGPREGPSEGRLEGEADDEEELQLDDEAPAEVTTPEPGLEDPEPAPVRIAPRPSPPRPWGGNRGAVSAEDLPPEELTPEMRWPPGTWVKVTDVVRHSTGEAIEGIAPGDVGQVIAALSQTLVVLFPTRDNRREVVHIDSIEAVPAPGGSRR